MRLLSQQKWLRIVLVSRTQRCALNLNMNLADLSNGDVAWKHFPACVLSCDKGHYHTYSLASTGVDLIAIIGRQELC